MARPTYTTDGKYAHVACPARLGHIKRTGPVTGQDWIIKPMGCWIDADDAAELVERTEQIWCFRIENYLTMYVVFYLDPSQEQIAAAPH